MVGSGLYYLAGLYINFFIDLFTFSSPSGGMRLKNISVWKNLQER